MSSRSNKNIKQELIKHLIVIFISILISVVFIDEILKFPGFFVEDDTFFYAQVAYNIGVNGISSFDGINTTDGYHLIWCWLLSALALITNIFTSDKTIHFMVFLSFYHYLVIWLAVMVSKNIPQIIISFIILIVTAYLMEDILLSIVMLFALKKIYDSGYDIYFLLALFIIPLVRIDGIILTGTFLFFFYLKDLRKMLISLSVLACGVLTQFLTNKLVFGSFFSVSSLVKLSKRGDMADNFFNLQSIMSFSSILTLSLFAISTAVLFFAYKRKQFDREKIRYYSVIIIALLFYIFYVYAATPSARQWYLTIIKVISLYILFNNLSYLNILRKRLFWYIIMVMIMISFFALYISKSKYYSHDNEYTWQFISQVRKKVPEDEKIFQVDASGITGYFTRRTIINGDGLMNSHTYFEHLKNRTLSDYIEQNNINYIITNREPEGNIALGWKDLRIHKDSAHLLIRPDRELHYDFNRYRLYKFRD